MITSHKKLTFDDILIRPQYSEIESRETCDVSTQFTRSFSISQPFVAAPMDTVCGKEMALALALAGTVGCIHRFMSIEEQVNSVLYVINTLSFGWYVDSPLPICAAIGVNGDYQARAEKLVESGANVLLIDVAHGHHKNVKDALRWLKKTVSVDVIAGNVATPEGVEDLQQWGADAVRVGIGAGSMCTTRIQTGIGVPQLSAIIDAARLANVPVIADGGIRFAGDAAKSLAAGASSVMIGSLFAGTNESPGEIITIGQYPHEKKMKIFRGSASAMSKRDQGRSEQYVEGVSHLVECRGTVLNILSMLRDGVQSAMSYVGARNIAEFNAKAQFEEISTSSLLESHPHGLGR